VDEAKCKCGGNLIPVPTARNKNTRKCAKCGKLGANAKTENKAESTEKKPVKARASKGPKAKAKCKAAAPANRTEKQPEPTERPKAGSGGWGRKILDFLDL
jgi:hypothetical protein